MAIAQKEVERTAHSHPANAAAREQEERERLNHLLQNAFSLTDVQEATRWMRAWAARHPEKPEWTATIFEQLALAEESAREADAEARSLGLSDLETQLRERVFALRRQVHAEDTPEVFAPALHNAREALREWQSVCPSDPQLPYLHEALDTEQTTHALLCQAV